MRKLFTILLMLISLSMGATTYYVATTGNDGAAGSLAAPWATWQKGFTEIGAGDTLYIRGGTYTPAATYQDPRYFGVVVNSVSGTSENKISVFNYPGETPVLDCQNIVNDARRVGIGLYSCDYWVLKGLNVTRVDQHATGDVSIGILIYGCDNVLIERCNAYYNQGMGIDIATGSSNVLVLNCDSYENHDPSSSYGNADGIGSNGNILGSSIIFRGCRSWYNSDDGFDSYADSALVTIDRCWAWKNGYREDHAATGGDGCGFKLGISGDYPTTLLRVVQNSLAFYNRRAGINSNSANCLINVYNNTIYANGYHGIWIFTADLAYVFRNNASFGNLSGYDYLSATQENYIIDHNSYDPEWQPTGVVATVADFISLTDVGMDMARRADGSLPSTSNFRLRPNSDLIDAGVDVNLDYDMAGHKITGTPDIGAMEYGRYIMKIK